LANQHSDFIDPFDFIDLLRSVRTANLRPFDIMLEAKAKDLALLRLREQMAKFAPDLVDAIF
jgi:UV DNA damage endonuclease